MKKLFYFIFILFFNFLIFFSSIYACEPEDQACLFNENPNSNTFSQLPNPTPSDFSRLPDPTKDDFNKLSNPTLDNFEKIKDSATIDEFNNLDSMEKKDFFSKDISNVNSKKEIFLNYLTNDLSISVDSLNGDVKSFDGKSIYGTNQKVDIDSIKNSDYSIKIDSSGKLSLIRNGGDLDFDGDVIKDSNGNLFIDVKGDNFKANNFDFEDSNLVLNLNGPVNVDLGNGFSYEIKKGNFKFKVKEFDSYTFIKNEIKNKIYFDSKKQEIITSGCCAILNYNNQKIEVGKFRKNGWGSISEKEINVAGFTKFQLGTETFKTDDKDFFSNIIDEKSNSANKVQTGIDKSVTFFQKDEDGDLLNLELNIGKKRNNEEFVDDVNVLLDRFVEQVKEDPVAISQVENDWGWLKENANELGLSEDLKVSKFLEKVENKLLVSSNLIPADEFISGLKGIKTGLESKSITTDLKLEALSRLESLYGSIGPKKISSFVTNNLPKNKKYAVGYELVDEYGLGDLVSVNVETKNKDGTIKVDKKSIIGPENVVFINTYSDGNVNIDLVAKNLEIPFKTESTNAIETSYRSIISIETGEKNFKAKTVGIEVVPSSIFIPNLALNNVYTNKLDQICYKGTGFDECQ